MSSSSASAAESTPVLPAPHPECTSARHPWVRELEQSSEWIECVNRPWAANEKNKAVSGCIGNDFVFHEPKVHMRFFWNARTSELAGVVHWDRNAEGPPKGAHGASIALVFDEILAYPVWRSGTGAFTANLSINLRRMVPLGSTQRFLARVRERKDRKIFTEGRITSPDGSVTYADATGLWIESAYMQSSHKVDATGAEKGATQQQQQQQQQQLPSKL